MIVGDPGSGKTTQLKRMLLWVLQRNGPGLGLPEGILPVFLPLRGWSSESPGWEAVLLAEEGDNSFRPWYPATIKKLLERQRKILADTRTIEKPVEEKFRKVQREAIRRAKDMAEKALKDLRRPGRTIPDPPIREAGDS